MSRRQLTSKQNAFLEFLQGHLATHRVWPTYREIVDHFEYRSPNSVTQNLQALSRKGFLERDQNGYRLIDRSGQDGTIAVRGTIRPGGVDSSTPLERLSLATLFADLNGLHALRLDAGVDRPLSDLDDARYVLVDDSPIREGDTAVILDDDTVVLARMSADGVLDAETSAAATTVGRYAGHAGPYGVVRHGSPTPAPLASDEAQPEVTRLIAAEAQVGVPEAQAVSAPTGLAFGGAAEA